MMRPPLQGGLTSRMSPLIGLILGISLITLFLLINYHQMFDTLLLRNERPLQKNEITKHKTKAFLCPNKTNEEVIHDSKGQDKEDIILLRWFNGLCGGTYIEMGALDGMLFSNSYLFNKQFNWKGLLIEPNPESYQALVQNRPDEVALVHAAVCDSEQTLHFVNKGAVGGIYEFAPQSFRDTWWKNISLDSPQVQEIVCQPLQQIIKNHLGEQVYFDFFSLDVEGAELHVLKSVDFDKVGFGIIFLEADNHNSQKNAAAREFLESKGYTYVGFEARSDWFILNDFQSIYKNVS